MRRFVTGLGADGRSTVIASGDPAVIHRFTPPPGGVDSHALKGSRPVGDMRAPDVGEVVIAELWATGPDVGAHGDPTTTNPEWDVETGAGCTRWRLVMAGPGWQAPMHRTHTIDYDVVVWGQMDLELEDQTITLRTGDCVVLPGVMHAWRAGPEGGAMTVTMVGLADSSTD